MLNSSVLVLNRGYYPVHVTNARRAFCLLYAGLARAINGQYETFDYPSWSALAVAAGTRHRRRGRAVRIPRVVVLVAYDRVPRRNVRFSRRNIFVRDRNTCQYCGKPFPSSELNLDHVVPRSQGGKTNWENIVCSCIPCNKRKGGNRPEETGMRLVSAPGRPAGRRSSPFPSGPPSTGNGFRSSTWSTSRTGTSNSRIEPADSKRERRDLLLPPLRRRAPDLAFAEPRDAQRRHRPAGPSSPLRPVDLPPDISAGSFGSSAWGTSSGERHDPLQGGSGHPGDTRSEAVEVCGAANTLVVRGGRLHAENTDGEGFLDALESVGWGRRFSRVVLLGAGGAARGIAFALGRAGAGEIVLLNRHPRRAERAARDLSGRIASVVYSGGDLRPQTLREAFRGADLIVQCTSLGLCGEWENFPIKDVQKSSRFADIVYRAGERT